MGSPVVARSRREIEIDLIGLSAEELAAFIVFAQVVEKNRAGFAISTRRRNGTTPLWVEVDLCSVRAAIYTAEKAMETIATFESGIKTEK